MEIRSISLSAVSGTGKGTVSRELLTLSPDMYSIVSSATTRESKEEVHGKKYLHFSYEEFEKLIAEGQLLEYNKYPSSCARGFHYYGSLKSSYEEIIALGKIALLEIDQNGLVEVKKKLLSSLHSFWLDCPLEESAYRIKCRGSETEEQQKERMKTGAIELQRLPLLRETGIINELIPYGKGAISGIAADTIHSIVLTKIPKKTLFI